MRAHCIAKLAPLGVLALCSLLTSSCATTVISAELADDASYHWLRTTTISPRSTFSTDDEKVTLSVRFAPNLVASSQEFSLRWIGPDGEVFLEGLAKTQWGSNEFMIVSLPIAHRRASRHPGSWSVELWKHGELLLCRSFTIGMEATSEGMDLHCRTEISTVQSDEPPNPARRWRPEVSAAFQVGLPQQDFEASGTSYGGAFFAGAGLPNLPIVLGGEFAFQIGEGSAGRTLAETDFSTIFARTSSDIVMLHFVARLQPASGRFRPFVDALIGFKHFETSTAITERPNFCLDPDDFICDSYLLDHGTNSSDIAFSYGLGAGLALQIHEGERGRVSVVVGARYLFGQEATYVLPSTIQIDETGEVEFETTRSRTDLLTTQVGVVMVF